MEELTGAFCAQVQDWQREGHQNRSGVWRAESESLGWLQFSGCEAGNWEESKKRKRQSLRGNMDAVGVGMRAPGYLDCERVLQAVGGSFWSRR